MVSSIVIQNLRVFVRERVVLRVVLRGVLRVAEPWILTFVVRAHRICCQIDSTLMNKYVDPYGYNVSIRFCWIDKGGPMISVTV